MGTRRRAESRGRSHHRRHHSAAAKKTRPCSRHHRSCLPAEQRQAKSERVSEGHGRVRGTATRRQQARRFPYRCCPRSTASLASGHRIVQPAGGSTTAQHSPGLCGPCAPGEALGSFTKGARWRPPREESSAAHAPASRLWTQRDRPEPGARPSAQPGQTGRSPYDISAIRAKRRTGKSKVSRWRLFVANITFPLGPGAPRPIGQQQRECWLPRCSSSRTAWARRNLHSAWAW